MSFRTKREIFYAQSSTQKISRDARNDNYYISMSNKPIFFPCLFLLPFLASAQSFKIVPLGVKGGIDESNLSAYMVAPSGTNNYICLDAGTLHFGIEKAVSNKVF